MYVRAILPLNFRASQRDVGSHWRSFLSLLDKGKVEKIMGGLWIYVIWTLWKWHNKVIFEGSVWDFRKIESEIKYRYWSRYVVRGDAELRTSYLDWATNTLSNTWNVN